MGNPRQHTLSEKLRSPYLWHRWAGLVLAALLVWVAVTGMLLNHEAELGLGARPVRSTWLLDAWEIPEPVLGAAYPTRLGWVVAVDERAWLDAVPLEGGPLVGAVDGPDWTLVATRDLLHLYASDGSLIERSAAPGGPALALGVTPDGAAALRASDGVLVSDAALTHWEEVTGPSSVTYVASAPLPEAEQLALRRDVRAHGLDWERVVRDLHAGHVPARWLRWVLDLVALGLIALALTGVWIHLQRRKH